ncbi:hypothetical protein BU23DRAFT_524290 [Bimuria novae-zelandiae CBS 107.79]|uniref:Cupredoxin n=1 Tax=Bimuria novae-zelandiae CBS 107.79 TaxID=1447943 RepID=A0A6A5VPC5_9PLEO|nr:hypothetical protein BU23DRAFT_524290 [Bimuria novae-zelandiae CBS 107.79]
MVSTSFVAVVFSALPLAFASYPAAYPVANGTATSAVYPTGTGSAGPSKQTVSVGKDGLVFTPDTIHAKKGDEIVFEFFPKNHAVVEADFNNPCNPSADGKGIFSGFIPSAAGRANKTFTVTIEDDQKPIWLYCPQNNPKPHCVAGMVAVINPPQYSHNTLNAFRMKAALVTGNATAPSGGPTGGQVTTPGAPSTPSGSPSPSGSSPEESTGGAGSSLAANGLVGLVGLFAALML